jgi:hypothetical protein
MANAEGKVITLSVEDARQILLAIRSRQDDCKRVTSVDAPNSEVYRTLDLILEKVKMKIARQM